jgi:hypothetical protein
MPHPFPLELRLAAACAMWPPSDRRIEAIRTAATGPLDWARFLRVARRHQVVGLVHDGLTRAQTNVPSEVAREVGGQAAILVRETLTMAREALRLQRLFDDAKLPVLFVKGAALSVLAFGNLGLRSSQDIDLLVNYETLPAATALILRAGYRRFDPSTNVSDAKLRLLMPFRKDLGFIHEGTGLQVELHWRLFLNPQAMAEPLITVASRIVPLSGAAGLRTLGEEDLFAYLCMHGALHWWYRLKWLADINALLAAASEDSVERLIRAAEVRGAGRATAQALLLCRRILGTPIPDRLMATLTNDSTLRWLEGTALNAMTTGWEEREPRKERFGTTRGSLSTFLLSRSWRYKLAELSVHLMSQSDMLTVPLPERLWFLYPGLRVPLWAWRHIIQHNSPHNKDSTPFPTEQ